MEALHKQQKRYFELLEKALDRPVYIWDGKGHSNYFRSKRTYQNSKSLQAGKPINHRLRFDGQEIVFDPQGTWKEVVKDTKTFADFCNKTNIPLELQYTAGKNGLRASIYLNKKYDLRTCVAIYNWLCCQLNFDPNTYGYEENNYKHHLLGTFGRKRKSSSGWEYSTYLSKVPDERPKIMLPSEIVFPDKIDLWRPLNEALTFKLLPEVSTSTKTYKEPIETMDTDKVSDWKDQNIRGIIINYIHDKDIAGACYELATYLLRKYILITFSDTGEIFIYQDGIYTPRGEEILSREIQNVLQNFCKIHLVNEILAHVRRQTVIYRDALKEPLDKICLENGILDLDTLQIIDHTPDIFFLNKLPIKYIPTADCPKIKKFLSEVVREEDIVLLQEQAGYCLYKEHFIHKAFLLVGAGANGKSTWCKLLKIFLGANNVTSIPLQRLEYNRFALSSMYGKLANIFSDLPSAALTGTSIFKMLVGQDLVPAERKFRDQFFFENYAKLIFSANQIPKSPEDTDAFFRRWIIIVFPNQFLKNADKQLGKKLTTPEELSGLLNFAIEGLKRLLNQSDFSSTKTIEDVRDQYIRMSDSVGAFVMDMVRVAPEKYVKKKELYTAYCDYCRNKNYPIEAENVFHKELQFKIRVEDYRPLLEEEGKKIRVQCWLGIKLADTPDNPDTPDATGQGSQGCQGSQLFNSLPELANSLREFFGKLECNKRISRSELQKHYSQISVELMSGAIAHLISRGYLYEPVKDEYSRYEPLSKVTEETVT